MNLYIYAYVYLATIRVPIFFTENIFIIPVARKGVNKQASYAVLKQTYAHKYMQTYRREIKG